MRDACSNSHRVHVFISAFHRCADECQRNELKNHNIHVFSLTKKDIADECISYIKLQIEKQKTVVLHLDECDYGTGSRQTLSIVYKNIRNNTKVKSIL